MARCGINGFGRIGRMILRSTIQKCSEKTVPHDELPKIVAINDPNICADHMAYLLKYDTLKGRFNGEIVTIGSSIKVNGQTIDVLNENDPTKISWGKSCVQYVVESSGKFTTTDKCKGHLKDGVKRVFIATVSKDAPIFIVGVNHDCFEPNMKVLSLSSPSTNCLATIMKIIHENFIIEEATYNVIEGARNNQRIQDSYDIPWERGRNGNYNLIPTYTNSMEELWKLFVPLYGKIKGLSTKTPIISGLMVDLNVKLAKPAPYDAIKCKIKEATATYMSHTLEYTEDRICSSDIIGNPKSAIFDATNGFSICPSFAKIIAWSDNEWAYANRVVEMLKYVASRESC